MAEDPADRTVPVKGVIPKPALEPYALVHLARSSQDVFQRCVDLALSATRATTVLAFLHRPGQDVLEVVAASGHLAQQAVGLTFSEGQALAWQVYAAGEVCFIYDAQSNPAAHFLSGVRKPGMYLGVPLVDPHGRVIGVLSADTSDSAEQLGEEDARVLDMLGQAAGVAYARLLALELAQQSAHRFERLARMSADLEIIHDPDDIARLALETLAELSGFTMGAVFEVQPGGLVAMRVLWGHTGVGEEYERELRRPHAATGILRRVIREERLQVMEDVRGPADAGPFRSTPAGRLKTALAAPLRRHGRVVGVIGLANFDQIHDVSAEIVTLLEMVAARIDRAAERVASVERLHQLRESALRAVGRVLEFRDDETFGHTDRVTALAVRLGERLGMSAEELQQLRWAAYLHDIGKVAVRDELLRKPGLLTPEERLEIQTHVVVGDAMLRDEVFVPREVRAVVRHHHERWDGKGYPDGLVGETIPVLARVFSVVDVYDALISARPYKQAWSREAALAELARCAGGQFDPAVVEAFLTLD